jgi:hypothetical protein
VLSCCYLNFHHGGCAVHCRRRYFHAYRIDHILGFFRIWEIPADCCSGILGRFRPSLPLTRHVRRARAAHTPPSTAFASCSWIYLSRTGCACSASPLPRPSTFPQLPCPAPHTAAPLPEGPQPNTCPPHPPTPPAGAGVTRHLGLRPPVRAVDHRRGAARNVWR